MLFKRALLADYQGRTQADVVGEQMYFNQLKFFFAKRLWMPREDCSNIPIYLSHRLTLDVAS